VVVLVVGVLVVTVVLGLGLISRLDDGQKVLNAARPAFTSQRVAGARGGINIIADDVNMANPIGTAQGGAAGEVPKLIAFVSQKTGLSQTEVLGALSKNFPHVTALLETIPLSAVTAEFPALFAFLEKALHVSEAQLVSALKTSFPGLTQAIVNLPGVTNGWNDVPGTAGFTRFDGTPIHTVPDVRTYFGSDLIPVLETQRGNYASLDGTSTINWIAPLLLIVGLVVIVFAALMIALHVRGPVSRGVAVASASVVPVVGVVVVALVLILALVPRVHHGQKLLDALGPVNTAARIQGDRSAINMVSVIVNMEDPIMTPRGGAAGEVPKLIAFVSKQTGLSQAEVLGALKKNFPHVTALLQAIPLSAVAAEFPALFAFLEKTLHVSEAQLVAALKAGFPGLTQSIINLPAVTNGWNDVPGTAGFTRFDGAPVHTVPEVRSYFSSDVIPVLETQRGNYDHLVSTSKINFIGPLVLIVGIIVIIYGLLMLSLARGLPPNRSARGSASHLEQSASPLPAAPGV
jgi:hypothetical protein